MDSKSYRVEWCIRGHEYDQHVQVTTVKIIEGYTTLDDAAQIIAVSRTGRQDDAGFIKILSTEEITCE